MGVGSLPLGPRSRRTFAAMTVPQTRHVTIRLAIGVDTDPIAGSVAVGDEEPRAFETWFELIAALDGARDKDRGEQQ